MNTDDFNYDDIEIPSEEEMQEIEAGFQEDKRLAAELQIFDIVCFKPDNFENDEDVAYEIQMISRKKGEICLKRYLLEPEEDELEFVWVDIKSVVKLTQDEIDEYTLAHG